MTASVGVGVQLPEVEYRASWDQTRELAVLAEDGGLDSIWVGDHLLYVDDEGRRGPWECWSILAGLAAVTSRVTIGPLVACLPFHNPAVLAKTVATVDEISHGRLILGVGAGWNRAEFDAFGVPFDHRVARFEESFEVLVRLLDGERVSFRGRFVRAEDAEVLPPPPRPGALPIMVGSNGARMLAIALGRATHWNTWYADFDHDPDRLAILLTNVERAWIEAGRAGEHLHTSAAVLAHLVEGDRSRPDTGLVGSDQQIVERLRSFVDLGIDHLQLVLDPIVPAAVERAAEIAEMLRRS